jgi:hypothetical protein
MISALLFVVFTVNTTFAAGNISSNYNLCIDFLSRNVKIITDTIYEDDKEFASLIHKIVMCTSAFLLFPFCLVKNFHQIRVSTTPSF